jgi:hypothetical protein
MRCQATISDRTCRTSGWSAEHVRRRLGSALALPASQRNRRVAAGWLSTETVACCHTRALEFVLAAAAQLRPQYPGPLRRRPNLLNFKGPGWPRCPSRRQIYAHRRERSARYRRDRVTLRQIARRTRTLYSCSAAKPRNRTAPALSPMIIRRDRIAWQSERHIAGFSVHSSQRTVPSQRS